MPQRISLKELLAKAPQEKKLPTHYSLKRHRSNVNKTDINPPIFLKFRSRDSFELPKMNDKFEKQNINNKSHMKFYEKPNLSLSSISKSDRKLKR